MSKRQLNIEQTLRDIYYSPTEGFRSTENIYQQAKEEIPDLKRNTVIQFLKRQKTYTQFKSYKGPKQFRATWVRDFGQMQIDLIDFHTAKNIDSKKIDNMSYMVVGIEILSQYAFALPLKKKDGVSTSQALEIIFDQFEDHFEMKPKIVQFDDGAEFNNPQVRKLLEEYSIQTWISNTKRKASIIERFNRTLKEKMMKYFHANNTDRWVPILDKLVENYNTQKNRSIGLPPSEVNEENKHQVWMRLYGNAQGPIPKPKYKVGDLVRIVDFFFKGNDQLKWKKLHPEQVAEDKERRRDPTTGKLGRHWRKRLVTAKNKPKFSDEIFKIHEVKLGHPIMYKLYSDDIQDVILGKYYERELSHVLNA